MAARLRFFPRGGLVRGGLTISREGGLWEVEESLRMRAARIRRLRSLAEVLGGSLVRQPRHRSLYLTDKLGGKTRTLYIPLDRLEQVKRWNANYKEARRLLRELSEIQRALLRAEIRAHRRPGSKS